MKAIFISDTHLRKATDERYVHLLNFFNDIMNGQLKALIDKGGSEVQVTAVTDIYIVGDLFDFWFCNKDKIYPEFIMIINKLIELQKSGIHIHLSEGNHDFFLQEYFHDVLGMEVFEEWADVKINGLRALIAHGDTTDQTNFKYLLFRRLIRSRPFYHFQRFIPASVRWSLASLSSMASKQMTVEDGDVLVEKMLSFAVEKLQEDYDAIIVGHCHLPVMRHYTVAGKKKTFIALGDWINHYSFAYCENKNFYLGYYRIK